MCCSSHTGSTDRQVLLPPGLLHTYETEQRRWIEARLYYQTYIGQLGSFIDASVYSYNLIHCGYTTHQERSDGRRSPAGVLGFVQGSWCEGQHLDRLFRLRADRRLDQGGYVRFRNRRLYGERGLAGGQVAVWLFGDTLTIEHATDALAQYRVAYEPDERHLRGVTEPHLFETRYPSPQLFRQPLDRIEWHPALRLPQYRARRKREGHGPQARLFPQEEERPQRARDGVPRSEVECPVHSRTPRR